MPCYNTAAYKRLQRVLRHQCKYTANAAKQHTGLYKGVLCDCVRSTARKYQTNTNGYNTACATLDSIPAPGRAQPIPDITAAPDAVQVSAYRPIIIRYIRCNGAPVMDPCQPVHQATSHASPAGSRCFPTLGGLWPGAGSAWHPPPGLTVRQLGRGGRRGTIDGYRRISFRAFAR